MPKSKNKRKKSKGLKSVGKRLGRFDPLALSKKKSSAEGSSKINDQQNGPEKTNKKKAVKPKRSIKELLFSNDCEGLFRLVTFGPLFVGAWLAGGLVLDQVMSFALVTAVLITAQYLEVFRKNEDIPFPVTLQQLLYLLIVGQLIALYSMTKSIPLVVVSAFSAGLLVGQDRLELKTTRAVLLAAATVVVRMPLMGIAGIFSQIFHKQPEVAWQYLVLGLVPGTILAASLIAKHAELFIAAGWRRNKNVSKKDGSELVRPGSLAQLYTLLVIFGPALPILLTPLGLFPDVFLLCAGVFLLFPKLATAFLKAEIPDSVVGMRTVLLAALALILVVVAGGLAQL